MVELNAHQLDRIFHALGDATRRRMLRELVSGERTVGQLAKPLTISLAAASKHIKALENAGFQVSSHDNGMSAYQRLREEPFEMLLTDIVMPEMDGIELARRASELDPDIKIMFITGFAAVALNSDSTAPKHAKVLSKPIHLRELVSEVHKLLAA